MVWRNSANLCARRALGAYVPFVGGLVAAPTSAVSSLRDQRAEIFLAFVLPSPPRGGWVGFRNYCLLCVPAHCVLPHAVRKEPLPHLAAGVRDCSAAGRRAPRSLLPVCFLAAGVSDWSACTEESPIPFGLFLLLGLGGSGAYSRS